MSLSVVSRQRSWNENENIMITKIEQVDNRDDVGNTALYYACQAGQTKIVKKFLDAHADVNKKSYGGITPLMVASQHGHLEIVELLLKYSFVEVNAVCKKGNTALHFAVQGNYHDLIRPLIEAGAEAKIRNQDGKSAFDLCTSGYMRRLLYLSGLGASPLHNACLEGNEEKLAQLLLNHDLNINEQNMHDMTCLMIVAEKGYLACLQILLSSSPPANPNLVNEDGNTALHLATKNGHWKLIEPLLRAGSDPNIKNKDDLSVFDIPYSGYIQRIIRDYLSHTQS